MRLRRISGSSVWVIVCVAVMVACVICCQLRRFPDLAWYLFWITSVAVFYPFMPLVRPRGNDDDGERDG
jgi:low affinity Fe/Cu permease